MTASSQLILFAVATVGTAIFIVVYLRVSRSASARQASLATSTGQIDTAGFLITQSLPGDWPKLARETMGMAKGNAPAMPIRLTSQNDDRWLYMTKTKYGSHPFTAKVALSAVLGASADRAVVMPSGSTLRLTLRDTSELLIHIHARPEDAAQFADVIQTRAKRQTRDDDPPGVVVTSTSPQ